MPMLALLSFRVDNLCMTVPEVPKANYDKIAGSFDQGRQIDSAIVDTWIGLVKDHGNLKPGDRILDLGCGVGRFAIPFATHLGLDTTGADAYQEMLDIARAKPDGDKIKWDKKDATKDLSDYPEGHFDAVFMSHLLHHFTELEEKEAVIAGSSRILRPMGALLIRYGAMEHIAEDVEHKFFEGATELDARRTLTTEATEDLLRGQGFVDVKSINVIQRTNSTAQEHVERARVKSTSVLNLIEDDAFERGLRSLAGYANQNPHDPWLLEDKLTLTVGYKPPAD